MDIVLKLILFALALALAGIVVIGLIFFDSFTPLSMYTILTIFLYRDLTNEAPRP